MIGVLLDRPDNQTATPTPGNHKLPAPKLDNIEGQGSIIIVMLADSVHPHGLVDGGYAFGVRGREYQVLAVVLLQLEQPRLFYHHFLADCVVGAGGCGWGNSLLLHSCFVYY